MYVFKETVDYIGHTLSKPGISPQKHKIEAIRKPRAPRNLTELKAYIKRFIKLLWKIYTKP